MRYEDMMDDPSRELLKVAVFLQQAGFAKVSTAPENLERPCGRGIMLMRHYMTTVAYNQRGNVVSMSKLRNGTR